MDKKPLIMVSFCAVVLLVLGSLSNVVGYQSVKSTTVSDSPLFQTRTQRATNQQQNSITSQYLGMSKESFLQFPFRDDKTEQLKKVIDIISKMDEKTFERFTELCIRRARQDNNLREINSNDIIRALILLRTEPRMVMNSIVIRNNQDKTASPSNTLCHPIPGCIFIWVISIIAFIVMMVIFLIVFIREYFSVVFVC